MPDSKKSSKGISPKKISDLKVVVLCVAAATTFWILNALNKDDYNTIVDYPIEFIYNQESYMAVNRLPSSIQVEINGNGWDLLRKYFNVNETPYPVELEEPASNNFILTSDLKRPLGEFLSPTQLISVLDDSIHYQIDQIQTIELTPILDSLSYSLENNYKLLNEIAFYPERISVTGPSSILQELEGNFPVMLNQQRITENINEEVTLEIPQEIENKITLNPEKIQVQFDVVAFLEGNKRLKVKKINFPRTVTLENEEVTIMMSYLVDERKVDELKELEFEAVLDYSKRNREDSTINVVVNPLPSYLEQVVVLPEIIKLNYE